MPHPPAPQVHHAPTFPPAAAVTDATNDRAGDRAGDGVDDVAVQALRESAAAVLAIHTSQDDMCLGCLDLWAILAPGPCKQRRWATAVLERYGVGANAP